MPQKPPRDEIFEYYNERAPEYEAFYAGEFPTGSCCPELYKTDTKVIQRLIHDYVKDNCIDIACGTGFWLPCYHRNYSVITLIDQSEGVLKECVKKIESLNIGEKTRVIRGNIFEEIPNPSLFDSAVAGFLISHFRDEEMVRFFTILRNILTPGGKFVIIDSVWGDEAKTHHHSRDGMATRRLYDGRTFQIYKRYFSKKDLCKIETKFGVRIDIIYWGSVFFLAVGRFL